MLVYFIVANRARHSGLMRTVCWLACFSPLDRKSMELFLVEGEEEVFIWRTLTDGLDLAFMEEAADLFELVEKNMSMSCCCWMRNMRCFGSCS